MCALWEAKPGNREPAESKKASPSDWLKFKEQPFTRGSGDTGQEAGEGRGRMQGRREGGKPTLQSFIFVFPNSAAFPWHSQDTSEQGGSRWEQREKGRKRERKRERV